MQLTGNGTSLCVRRFQHLAHCPHSCHKVDLRTNPCIGMLAERWHPNGNFSGYGKRRMGGPLGRLLWEHDSHRAGGR